MLIPQPDVFSCLGITDKTLLNSSIKCWTKKEKEFNIYCFSVEVENEKVLEEVWEEITNSIAIHFQTKLPKDIEVWNIYVAFMVSGIVSKELKYQVEQDKFSTRKLVFECITEKEKIPETIERKLFSIDTTVIQEIEFPKTTAEAIIQRKDPALLNLLKKNGHMKPKEIIQLCLEVLS